SATFWLSKKPPSPKPRRNAATRCADSSGDLALMNPTTGIAGCCARTASGHAMVALPRSAMKLRRLMQIARRGQSLPKGSVVRHSKIRPLMTRWVDAVEKIGDGGVRLLLELLMVSFWPRSIAYLSGGCGTRPTEDAT